MATDKSYLINDEDGLQPMDPSSECLNSHHVSLAILGIAESEIPIDVEKIVVPIKTDLLRVNPVFSSIVVRKSGKQWWKQVEVQFEDHIVIPTFPPGLTPDSYTEYFDEYLSKLGVDKLPESRPLWEFHIIKYPTQTAAGTVVFKMSHALGDGFSIMGAVFSVLRRADDSSLPLTFPSTKRSLEEEKLGIWRSGLRLVSGCFITVSDVVGSFMHTAFFGDSPSVIRSGAEDVECLPKHTTRVVFDLEDIHQVKTQLGVTINDIVVGIIFSGVLLYEKTIDRIPNQTKKSGLVLLNTRMINGYRSVDEMLKQKMWGNQFSFVHVPVPSWFGRQTINPKELILEASKIIKRSRNSIAIHLNGIFLSMIRRFGGQKALSKYLHSVMKNTSFGISNLVGPMEKLAIADHPINNIYFTMGRIPQSLSFPVMSYMGKLVIVISAEKEFIDAKLLAYCMNESLRMVLKEIFLN